MIEIPTDEESSAVFGRRQFFNRFKGFLSNTSQEEIEKATQARLARPLTRRTVVKSAIVFGSCMALDQLIQRDFPEAEGSSEVSANENNDTLKPGSSNSSNTSIFDTMLQTFQMMGAELISGVVAHKLGINIGNSGMTVDRIRTMLRNPRNTAFSGTVVAGVYEEALCRLAPNLLFAPRREGYAWDVGVPSAVVFAGLHNVQRGTSWKECNIKTNILPVPQFIGGIFLHKIFREKSYGHAAFAHAFHNTIPTLALLGGYAVYSQMPDEEKEKVRENLLVHLREKEGIRYNPSE